MVYAIHLNKVTREAQILEYEREPVGIQWLDDVIGRDLNFKITKRYFFRIGNDTKQLGVLLGLHAFKLECEETDTYHMDKWFYNFADRVHMGDPRAEEICLQKTTIMETHRML